LPEAGHVAHLSEFSAAFGVSPSAWASQYARVQFDICAPMRWAASLAFIGGDENRHAATGITQGSDEMGQMVSSRATSSPPSVVRSSRFSGRCRRRGFVAQGDLAFQRWRPFRKFTGWSTHHRVDVGVADVTTVFAQVRGDAVGASICANIAARTGSGVSPPRAHRCHVVDVHTQFGPTSSSLLALH
jgi:hypothetical protein